MYFTTESTGSHQSSADTPPPGGSQGDNSPSLFEQVTDPRGVITLTPTVLDDVPERPLTAPERFEEFHALNPHVYATLVRLSRRFIDATGRRKLAVQRVVEIARWDLQIATRGEEEFEINNSFTPYYARLIMLQEPDLDAVFDIRRAPEPDAWIADRRRALRGGS